MSVRTDNVNVNVNINGTQGGQTLREMQKNVRQLRSELSHLVPGTQAFIDKLKELHRAEAQLRGIQNEIRGVGGMFSRISKEIKQFGILAAGYLGFQFITDAVKNIISKNARLSDELADIQKTTGMTKNEVKSLNRELSKIDTRTATSELRKIAAAAGQLGIVKEDILAFTKATDMLVVALGDEFQGGADEVTKNLGALRNIFSDIKSDKIDQDMLRIGNALNELGADGMATAPIMTDFASRIGGVGIPLGLTSAQVLALSATMQEMNINAERGGTAMVKILQKMSSHTKDFAQIANMDVRTFTELVNKDLYGAFLKVVEGSKNAGKNATDLAGIMDKLGIEGAGASEVFMKLGSNTKLLDEKLKLSNKSLKETDSIMAEFTTKNETFGAKIDKLGKSLAGAFVNSGVMEAIESIVDTLVEWTEIPLSEKMQEEQNQVNILTMEINTANTTNERRMEIYDELARISPEIVKGIDRESISLAALTRNVEAYNIAQINRIVVQKKQEELDDATDDAATQRSFVINEEERIRKLLLQYSQSEYRNAEAIGKVSKDANKTLEQKIALVKNLLFTEKGPNSYDALKDRKELEKHEGFLVNEKRKYNEALGVTNTILKEKNSIMKELGISTETPVTENPAPTAAAAPKQVPVITSGSVDNQAKLMERLRDELKNLQDQIDLNRMAANDREVQQVWQKYEKMITAAKGNGKHIAELEKLRGLELEDLKRKQAEKEIEIQQKAEQKKAELLDQFYGMLLNDRDRELFLMQQKHSEINEQAMAAGLDASVLYDAQRKELDDIVQKWNNKEVEDTKKKNDKIKADNKEALDEKIKAIDQESQLTSNVYSIYSGLFDLLGDKSKSAAEYQKRLAIFQIAIDTATAVSKAIATGSAVGITPIEKAIAITGNIALVLANFKKVKSILQESGDIPAPQHGKGALLEGPLHSSPSKGMPIVDPVTGKVKGLVEGGEVLLSRNTVKNNPELVSALLHSSMNRDGAAVPFSYTPRRVSFSNATQAISYERGTSFAAPVFSPSNNTSASQADLAKVIHELTMQLQAGITAQFNYNQYTRDQAAINQAATSAQIG